MHPTGSLALSATCRSASELQSLSELGQVLKPPAWTVTLDSECKLLPAMVLAAERRERKQLFIVPQLSSLPRLPQTLSPCQFPQLPVNMNDSELKKLLQETYPVLPGQQERAWNRTREALFRRVSFREWVCNCFGERPFGSIALIGTTCAILACLIDSLFSTVEAPIASAESADTKIRATSYYSDSAQAQIIRLEGIPPAQDDSPNSGTKTDPATKPTPTPPPNTL